VCSSDLPETFEIYLEIAREASVFASGHDQLFDRVLDLPGHAFARQVLSEWSAGYLGGRADSCLASALGLDETWRNVVESRFAERGEFIPRWMTFKGVESEMTGAGTLRLAADEDPFEVLADEFAAINRVVRLAKLIFLDLSSTLSSDYFYPLTSLAELLQISSAFSVFSSTLHALEDSRAPLYIPLQRASYLNDPFHVGEFESWLRDLFDNLLVPLGVGSYSEDGEAIRLQAATLRLPSPADTTDEARLELLRELFQDPGLELKFPTLLQGQLREVPDFREDASIQIAAPIQAIRDWIGGRDIESFDGHSLHLS